MASELTTDDLDHVAAELVGHFDREAMEEAKAALLDALLKERGLQAIPASYVQQRLVLSEDRVNATCYYPETDDPKWDDYAFYAYIPPDQRVWWDEDADDGVWKGEWVWARIREEPSGPVQGEGE